MKTKHSSSRGSFTVEASIAMVSLIFFILFLMSYIGGLYTESLIEECLVETSQVVRAKLPLLMSAENLSLIEEPLFRGLVKEEFKNAFEKRSHQRAVFRFGIKELKVDSSESLYISETSGKMKFSIGVQWEMIFLERAEINIERTLYCQRLPEFFQIEFANKIEVSQSKTVYLADHPSVYHTSASCRSLKNRNKNTVILKRLNGQYRECKFCARERKNDIQ